MYTLTRHFCQGRVQAEIVMKNSSRLEKAQWLAFCCTKIATSAGARPREKTELVSTAEESCFMFWCIRKNEANEGFTAGTLCVGKSMKILAGRGFDLLNRVFFR